MADDLLLLEAGGSLLLTGGDDLLLASSGEEAAAAYPTVTVEVAFGYGWLDPTPVWTDISAYVDFNPGLSIKVGRSRELDTFQAGTCGFTLINDDRRFDPLYEAGPYYGQLLDRVPCRVLATWDGDTWPLFRGFVDAWPQTYTYADVIAETQVVATDAFAILAAVSGATGAFTLDDPVLGVLDSERLAGGGGAAEMSGERVDALLDVAGWPDLLRDIAPGSTTCQPQEAEDEMLAALQLVEASEDGFFYVRGDGYTVFHGRHDRQTVARMAEVQAIFTDQPTGSGTGALTGGTASTVGAYTYLTFTTSGTLTHTGDPVTVGYLVVGGGAGGGNNIGGGGGGGRVKIGSGLSISSSQAVTVGTGGNGSATTNVNGANGGDSSIGSLVVAKGGGGGQGGLNGTTGDPAPTGGSGGGAGIRTRSAGPDDSSGAGPPGFGNPGGANTQAVGTSANNSKGAGGGGAGGAGTSVAGAPGNPGHGGAAVTSSFTGTAVDYAAGGGGGAGQSPAGTGGAVGAGNGSFSASIPADPTANTGHGGGGGGPSSGEAGDGATGLVAVRVGGGGGPYADLTLLPADSALAANDVRRQRDGGVEQTATDAASIVTRGRRTHSRTGLVMDTDAAALALADAHLNRYKEPGTRIDSLLIDPLAEPATLWPEVLGRQILDRIEVDRTPQGIGDPIALDVLIQGVEHTWSDFRWRTRWYVTPADDPADFYFTLDDLALGQLDDDLIGA